MLRNLISISYFTTLIKWKMNKWSPGSDNCWKTSFSKNHSTDPNNWFSTPFLEQAWESWDSDSQLTPDPTIWIQLLIKQNSTVPPFEPPFSHLTENELWSIYTLTLLAVICLTSIATWGTNNRNFMSDATRGEKHILLFIDS